jgi:hypothetical protein
VLAIVVLAMAIALAASAQDRQEKPSVSPGGEKLTSHLVKTGLLLDRGRRRQFAAAIQREWVDPRRRKASR